MFDNGHENPADYNRAIDGNRSYNLEKKVEKLEARIARLEKVLAAVTKFLGWEE